MKIQGLCKSYPVAGRLHSVLRDLTLEAADDGITVILGRSGCGKTTLLRLAAGLEQADAGVIEGFGKRRMGVIFQEPRLMPWLTVEKNILFGAPGAAGRLRELLDLTGLEGFEKAYPAQLSGGMQQRTALARALAYEPDYLLMDEPFAALDYFTRHQMQQEVLAIHQKEKKGVLFVTHSIDEALAIGTKIAILDGGSCRKEYDLSAFPVPRDMLSEELLELKRDIIAQMGEKPASIRLQADEIDYNVAASGVNRSVT